MEFDFSREKNQILFEKRGVTFYKVVEAISENGILLNIKHPNSQKYPDQWMLVVEFDSYTYCVPYIRMGKTWYLKTVFPNRNFLYLLDKNEESNEK